MRIGFVGLGVMGRPMAEHLIAVGHEVRLNRVKEASAHLVKRSGRAKGTAAAAAERVDAVILIVPDAPDVETVQQLMNAAIGRGDGELDHAALIRTVDALSGR
ncbi:UNVERIFIED_ORG: 2-hydroxy-3-oxopropionate reductase [Martelella mediterranea]